MTISINFSDNTCKGLKEQGKLPSVTLGSENLEIGGFGFTKPHQRAVFGRCDASGFGLCGKKSEVPISINFSGNTCEGLKEQGKLPSVTLGSENLEIEGIGFAKPHQLVVFGRCGASRIVMFFHLFFH